MSLQEFIERYKTDCFDSYEITDSKLWIRYERILTPGTYPFLSVPGNKELHKFSDLLDGRICHFEGKESVKGVKLAVIEVDTFRVGY
ncbi:hypothetical protein H6F86_20770 [Phormidium sp. FACHB-592]|uniref:Uncharacterized protein n=1 Tax=Stenomitos frigidus AS-A4 TaxID=2933935 RepID=A0ABV0KEJ6_9CYAN|nr:hypothetical protein [Phormidium sp. FACHB-592]MBD2076267.1 hypothetical protein [Phormidium sp. FACHB-592]